MLGLQLDVRKDPYGIWRSDNHLLLEIRTYICFLACVAAFDEREADNQWEGLLGPYDIIISNFALHISFF